MLEQYLSGAIPHMIERGRVLTASIPRNLPPGYDALRFICKQQVDELIQALLQLQSGISVGLSSERWRKFKRIVSAMDSLEGVAITALNRASEDDHQVNLLIRRIAQEIQYPRLTPTVISLSQNYFVIYPSLNLLCIPLVEGKFLLHLPDLYHELAHPFFTEKNDPILEPFQAQYMDTIAHVLTHFEEDKDKEDLRRGPKHLYELLHVWQKSWIRFWVEELFCDLYGVYTLGPAFVWSHLHLAIKRGGDPYSLSSQITSHPCDHARMVVMLHGLRNIEFQEIAGQIEQKWNEFLEQVAAQPEPEYYRCYPDNLLKVVPQYALTAVNTFNARIATPRVQDPIHTLLNKSWEEFWKNPTSYVKWEKEKTKTWLTD